MTNGKKMTGVDVLVKCLLEENVKYIFGITDGQLLRIYEFKLENSLFFNYLLIN